MAQNATEHQTIQALRAYYIARYSVWLRSLGCPIMAQNNATVDYQQVIATVWKDERKEA